MAKMYYEQDCNKELLKGKTIAVIGYGSQGHAHALNLHESGYDVVVGLYEGSKTKDVVAKAGLRAMNTDEAVKMADIIMILVNDEKQGDLFETQIKPNLRDGQTLCFAHGFNILYGQIQPPSNVDVIMIAPKGPGHTVRYQYTQGRGVPCLIAVEQDYTGHAEETALAYAYGIGGARAGILETTFKEETETDLFGEQAVLCGGVSELIKAGFDVLVEAGYQPESAYLECLHEMKLIVDMIALGGLSGMRSSVSDTAEYGDYMLGNRIITEGTKDEMRKVLKEVQDGSFAKQWIQENKDGRHNFEAKRKVERALPIETIGVEIREKMFKGK